MARQFETIARFDENSVNQLCVSEKGRSPEQAIALALGKLAVHIGFQLPEFGGDLDAGMPDYEPDDGDDVEEVGDDEEDV